MGVVDAGPRGAGRRAAVAAAARRRRRRALRELTDWERLVADYGSFRISIAQHPMALLRPELPETVAVEPRPGARCRTAAG